MGAFQNFNPRSPYGERRHATFYLCQTFEFQSTLPLRGATATIVHHVKHLKISIHAPLTGSDFQSQGKDQQSEYFNPRSPYGERQLTGSLPLKFGLFQSTLPLRGATTPPAKVVRVLLISIHAPLTGSDRVAIVATPSGINFNPRSPYGERLRICRLSNKSADFNPRSPYGERRAGEILHAARARISIHAPLTGSDRAVVFLSKTPDYFNPRSPYGERLYILAI